MIGAGAMDFGERQEGLFAADLSAVAARLAELAA